MERKINESITWDKYAYTIILFFSHLFYGMVFTLVGPALVDLMYIFDTNMNIISLIPLCIYVGYLVGSLFGFFYNYINRQLTLIVMLTFLGVGTVLQIFCPNLWTLFLCTILLNMGGGAWDSGNSMWLIELWRERSPTALQFSQFMFGLGSIIGPLMDEQFVTGDLTSQKSTAIESSINLTNSSKITTNDINDTIDRRSKLRFPFIITGSLQSIIPVLLLIMFVIKRYEITDGNENMSKSIELEDKLESVEITNSKRKIIPTERSDRKLLIALLAISLATYAAVEMVYFQFSSTYYQYIAIKIPAPKAAQIMSVMMGCFTAGRLVSAGIALKISAKVMIIYHYVIVIISMLFLYFGQDYETIIWIGSGMIGFGFSAMWPAFFALSEKYIAMTNKISTIYSFAIGIAPAIAPFVIGPYIEKSAVVFTIIPFTYLIISISLFVFILLRLKK